MPNPKSRMLRSVERGPRKTPMRCLESNMSNFSLFSYARFEQKPLYGTKMDKRPWVTDGQKNVRAPRKAIFINYFYKKHFAHSYSIPKPISLLRTPLFKENISNFQNQKWLASYDISFLFLKTPSFSEFQRTASSAAGQITVSSYDVSKRRPRMLLWH